MEPIPPWVKVRTGAGMSLSGNLKTMDLAELLQWVAIGRKTGALAFVKDNTKNYIVFREGSIISSGSNEPMYQLGQYLLFQGKLTENDFKRAFELEQETRGTLSPILVLQGFVSQQDLQQAMISRTEEVIYDLFLWEEGNFNFTTASEYDADQLCLINIDVNSVIFEGVRRKDEWKRIRAVFPSNNVTLAPRPGADLKSVPLTVLQNKLLSLASSGKTISEMILEVHGSDFQVNFELFQLYDSNILEVKQIGEEPKKTEDPSRLFDQGLEYVKQNKLPEAIEVFQKVLATDPQNFRAYDQIEQAEKAICQDLYKNALPPDKVPYLLVPVSLLKKLELTHREGYVASRIDGTWDIRSIVTLSPLPELEVLRTLQKLIISDVVALISRPSTGDTSRGQPGSRRRPKEPGTTSY
jgi:tetratricopeptide (TPR) repeat protein